MVSRGASSGGRPWPLPSWGVCVRACVHVCVCVRLCVVLLRPWPDVCGVFTHVSWHVLTCLRCVIVCVNVQERSDPVDRWKKNHPPVLPLSVCLSVHYYPSFLFLSQSPLSLYLSLSSLCPSLSSLCLSISSLCLHPCITTAALSGQAEIGSAAAWECCREAEGESEGGAAVSSTNRNKQ